MRKYNRSYIHRLTHSDAARALLPSPFTRVELPPSVPPQTPAPNATAAPFGAAPPGGGTTPPR